MEAVARAIHPLSDHVINQIAAGEVIERPASVVKELVENSLDAGARDIDIDIGGGGLEYVTVTDNGAGIPADEIHAALKRHWTSKINDTTDLARIGSLGFRGEALASIAAVADVEIIARTSGDDHAWRVATAAGQPPAQPTPYQAPLGTRVSVRDLFYLIPARRRFLKRPRTEFLHVQRFVRRIGFACPHAALRFTQAGSRGLHLRPSSWGEASPRWRALFGEAFARAAIPIDVVVDNVSVQGWIGGPDLATNTSELQYIALNGRHIRDRHIAHAIRLAFDERLPPGKFPAYALAIELPVDQVDVNVHPGKLEVRFVSLRDIHDLVVAGVKRALGEDARLPPAESGSTPSHPATINDAGATYHRAVGTARSVATADPADVFGRPLALVDDRYLVFLIAGELRGLDLRDTWAAAIAQRLEMRDTERPSARPLLIPERLSLDERIFDADLSQRLGALGFDIDDLGAAGYVLRSIPAVLPDITTATFCRDLPVALEGSDALTVAVARAAAAAIDLGDLGLPSARVLSELMRAAAAAEIDPTSDAFAITGGLLRRLASGDA